jgi:dienelactone hydrolase
LIDMTRRDLARIAAAGALAQVAAKPADSAYTGALDGSKDKVDLAEFDPIVFAKKLYESAPLQLTFRAKDKKQAEIWQKKLHAKVQELLGGFPAERTALRPQTLEVREFPAYRREKFVFESRPGMMVLGYLLTPLKAKGPFAPVICVPGHGRGVDDIVGVDIEGRDRTDKDPKGYEFDFAIQVVEHGLAAVAIEPLGFGCRRDPVNARKGLAVKACEPAAGEALLLGQTLLGWRVWDVMRTIDWIEARPELDAKRVGCMGISGGGTCTLFSAAMEPRIKAAMVSCYLNTFRDSIFAMNHCVDNYVPGILNWAEMYDVAGLIAPRALFAESGEKDTIFPIAGSLQSYGRVKAMYDVFGAGGVIEHETFDGPHSFWGKRGIPFLVKHLA